MPNLTADTVDLLADLAQFPLTQGAAEIVAELNDRIIQSNDADDSEQHRGGIRPKKAPIVP